MINYQEASNDLGVYLLVFRKEFLSESLIKEARIEGILEPGYDRAPICPMRMDKINQIETLFNRLL